MSQPKTPADLLLPILPAGDVFAEKCPSRQILNHVTSRWGVLILIALLDDTHRFSQLRRRIGGVSERMLAQTLQWLESDGFVLRTAYPVVPPHVEYSLTPLGKEVGERVKELAVWVEGNLDDILAAQQSSEQQSIKP
ncbi:helix-turn-helix transcriptional regulator [Pectobacterium versatile]|uniref:winged helix-turn-helix transcriptional regulator n=1 Tax=Pectobacterium versatile TaxID=2488639 RepID=UPI0018EC8415|nr:helix-turn-helix domain-containing protein [Pectobacterium versatile]QQG28449.1 helix-turn-helix transcriptional regulator [Pectobacterium carotovorum]MCA5933066.1 helix-turn-helix transcriptional regulator [Pectobacterium versatile]MCA5949307.1 helix-turn-helix transcriptional regulator [Pectobacterium versatile]MCA5953723.1 helix-turn-helix transcriptional regulator [Pectobacterium versatile]UCP88001.1 helix-turn-helix transcriptional regulator [Pectobacterium versatile]